MTELRIGLIGSGYMARSHVSAFVSAPTVFGPEPARPVFEMIAEASEELAAQAAADLGFRRWTADWRELVADPAVDVVDVTTPNNLHRDICVAAAHAGKHVYCEKPLAMNAAEAREMVEVAEAAGVTTLVGFNYLKNPLQRLARDLIAGGDLGEIIHYRGRFDQDYLGDPNVPHTWRCDKSIAGSGIVADGASHAIAMVHYLLGDITEVCGRTRIVFPERPVRGQGLGLRASAVGDGKLAKVDTEDTAQFLFTLENGATGSIEASRVATGRKWALEYEIHGTKGALQFFGEQRNELRLYRAGDSPAEQGFKSILTGPSHPPYDRFQPVAGAGLGYSDLKVIEVRELIEAVAEGRPGAPDFRFGLQVSRVIDAVLRSAAERRWVATEEIA